ncbi:SEC-C domain-containing protein [Pseudomonas sp. Irchel 3E13]|uniref:SEC-C domain-containing protein n=1 Tax=Pseudomonas sp. Irchel 3E13 TaxID=2008975 RepID=UPI000BA3E3D9|nr:SEC-C domain-containing protein [Pseudomonas sp. Irchel 3E13]
MLKPIVKEPSVNESERILAKVANNNFFSLWSYPSLFRSVGKGKELADLTIYFDNTLILFSDKGQVKFQSQNETLLAWSRWYRTAVKESAKQLHGAEKFVRNLPDQIFLNSKLVDQFPFDISNKDLKIHLVAVTRGITKEAKRYFDSVKPGSSGSLGFCYAMTEKEILQHPFFVGDVDPSQTFVHILDESSIELLLEELCTPSDFIHYLEAKEQAVRRGGLVVSYGEEETLAHYLLHEDKHGFGAIEGGSYEKFIIPEWQWREFKGSIPYGLRYELRKYAKIWNSLVARFSDCVVNATVGEGGHLPLLTHANAIQVLASENVVSSAVLAKALFQKYGTVPEMARSARIVSSTMQPGRIYVFIFFPWDTDYKDYEKYREARLECMGLYALVARYKYQKAKEILVFGSATKGGTPGSETIFVVDNSVPLAGEERLLAQRVMKNENILNSVTEKRTSLPGGVGRNELCPCGSGKKFKKCHYQTGFA